MSGQKTSAALTIAGSDSSGGAGIQADLKTFSALGVYGASVITALTAQNTTGVSAIHVPPGEFVYEQMKAVFSDLNIGAVKIGMLANAGIVEAVARGLRDFYAGPVVLDPVMVATSGDRLLEPAAEQALKIHLIPGSAVITPNLPEAACLLGKSVAGSEDDIKQQLAALLALGPLSVYLKGGHGKGEEIVDYFQQAGSSDARRFSVKRVNTSNTHGTGCTLSAAICAGLAIGENLESAVSGAKTYLTEALLKADSLRIGDGAGPVHHFHNQW